MENNEILDSAYVLAKRKRNNNIDKFDETEKICIYIYSNKLKLKIYNILFVFWFKYNYSK